MTKKHYRVVDARTYKVLKAFFTLAEAVAFRRSVAEETIIEYEQ